MNFFHSVELIDEKCIGCTKCLMSCPVEAVRIKNGKAVIYRDKCIDCGECIKVCPYGAHISIKNSLQDIYKFKIKIAVPSVTVYSQFGQDIKPKAINEAILSLGFDEVFDMTYACDIATQILKKEIQRVEKPAISVLCPSVLKLIETEYPSLINHLVKMLTPIEISSLIIREKYMEKGYKNDEVGIFYLTPCPSWGTKINEMNKNSNIRIDGIIAISDIYPKLIKNISKDNKNDDAISKTGIMWAYAGGQSEALKLNDYIAVDGIKNVIKVFNDIENDRLKDVEYIEAFACSRGCVGGLLLVENPYNAERISKKLIHDMDFSYNIENYEELEDKIIQDIKENRNTLKLSDDFESAVFMLKKMNNIINMLPSTDCGLCGSPSCKAFAEDVVKGLAKLEDCRFLKTGGDKNEG